MSESGPGRDSSSAGRPRRRWGDRITGPFDALRIVTAPDAETADAALERLVSADAVEDGILQEIRDARPLARPADFPLVHRGFVKALEVYDRNARRAPQALPAGFLRPVVTPVVALMSLVIARTHQKQVVREVRRLYLLREAGCEVGTADYRMLATARRQLDRLQPDLAGGGFAIPAFLLGGAALSAVVSALQNLLRSQPGRVALLAAILLLSVGAFWCIVSAAAVTRRRTHLVLDLPLAALWECLGAAGSPPRDPSRIFVAVASVFLLLGWIIAPVAAAFVFRTL